MSDTAGIRLESATQTFAQATPDDSHRARVGRRDSDRR
jgi:hypothetical protein